jgi:hypothetical protein
MLFATQGDLDAEHATPMREHDQLPMPFERHARNCWLGNCNAADAKRRRRRDIP